MTPKAFAKEWYELLTRADDWAGIHAHMLGKLRASGKLAQLSFVLRLLRSMLYAHAGVVPAIVSSARPMDQKLAQAFAVQVFSGRPDCPKTPCEQSVEVALREDPSLIAGAVLETDELRVDASLRGQLDILQQAMTQKHYN